MEVAISRGAITIFRHSFPIYNRNLILLAFE
jgi:hypothetical protein